MTTDHSEIFPQGPTPQDIEQRCKAILLPLLRQHGVTRVEIEYDGEGDEGSVCDVLAYQDGIPRALPNIECTLVALHYGGRVEESTVSLEHALSEFASNAVSARFEGWENGTGARGEIVIDVETEAVSLEHNNRFYDYDQTCVDL